MWLNVPGDPLTIESTLLATVNGFPITNTLTTAFLQIFVFLYLVFSVRNFTTKNPNTYQVIIELIVEMVHGVIDKIVNDAKVTSQILYFVSSIVIFILISNIILTFLPILAGFTYNGLPMFRSYTNDFNTTLMLALVSVVATQIYSIGKVNPLNYIFRFIKIDAVFKGFAKSIKDGVMSIVDLFVGILDIVSEFAKVISLSLRLFGNMYAGELLIGVLMTMLGILLPLPIIGLALLSGVIQSIVFGALVSSFLAGVLKDENI